jgi:hypothetical protein
MPKNNKLHKNQKYRSSIASRIQPASDWLVIAKAKLQVAGKILIANDGISTSTRHCSSLR